MRLTTTRLKLSLIDHWRIHAAHYRPTALAMSLIVVLLFARMLLNGNTAPAVAVPTPGLIIMIATQAAVAVPTAAPVQQAAAVVPAVRYVVAFDQPAGNVLGPIPAPGLADVLARYGDGWVLVPWQGGQVWVRSADVGLPDVADLAPPPQPQVVYVAAPAYAAPVVEAAPIPATVYQSVSERQQNIQNRLIEIPTIAPMEMTDANAEWARQQWAAEHPEAGR
jgi:hypothetical protein